MIELPHYIPDKHRQSITMLCRYFLTWPIHGIYANGSLATGNMDEYSDLDLAVTFSDNQLLSTCWDKRRDWSLPYIHLYEADHRKPNLVVLILENGIKADIFLTTPTNIQPKEKPPFLIIHDPSGDLASILDYKWVETPVTSEIMEICLEEEKKFWGWMVFDDNHFGRKNYYLLADDFFSLRKILQNWLGIWAEGKLLTGREFFEHPKLQSWKELFALHLFPKAEKDELMKAHQYLIKAAIEIRKLVLEKYPNWKWSVSEEFIHHVKQRWHLI